MAVITLVRTKDTLGNLFYEGSTLVDKDLVKRLFGVSLVHPSLLKQYFEFARDCGQGLQRFVPGSQLTGEPGRHIEANKPPRYAYHRRDMQAQHSESVDADLIEDLLPALYADVISRFTPLYIWDRWAGAMGDVVIDRDGLRDMQWHLRTGGEVKMPVKEKR